MVPKVWLQMYEEPENQDLGHRESSCNLGEKTPKHFMIQKLVYNMPFPEGVNEPIFFQDSVNAERYINDILQQFFNDLTEEEKRGGWFQHDGATAHTANASMHRQYRS